MIFRTRIASTLVSGGLLLATLTLVACGSDEESSTETDAPATTAVVTEKAASTSGAVLSISDFTFSPLAVAAGDKITINNVDSAPHTVTADDGSFSVDVATIANLTISSAGTYEIHCEIHPAMKGTIIVS